jgi:G:T/U-mismatch repair DNA glycosylase
MAGKSGRAAPKTKISETGHPYQKFENTPLWRTVYKAVDDLVENGDIEEKTHRNYVVGYLCKLLSTSDRKE